MCKFSGCLLLLLAAREPGAAQCIVENTGSSANIYRPRDADVPAAGFSPISEVNRRLPGWLCFNGGYRARWEGYTGGSYQAGQEDSYVLTRFRLGMAIRPRPWFRTYVELQDATAFGKEGQPGPPYQSTWDLRRAYMDIGDVGEGRFSLRIGRQDLSYGYLRLVGTSYWRNASRGYDAVLAGFNWPRWRVNVFAAAPVIAGANGLSHHQQGNNLHGIYAIIRNPVPGSTIEPYALWRLSPGFKTEAGAPAKLNEKMFGIRWAGAARYFDYDAEATAQRGHAGSNPVQAWGWSLILGRTFPSLPLRPRIFVKYDFASGDRDPRDGVRGTFDQLYPNIHDHHGVADQVAWQNLKGLRTGLRTSLRPNWMVSGMYNNWWLASATDGFYSSSGSIVARDPSGRSGTHIGEEYDLETSFRVNRQLELGCGIGRVYPGSFLSNTGHGHAYTYPYLMLNYNVF